MKKWYIIHTLTGSESKVKTSIENRLSTADLKDKFGEVLIPTEQVSEIKSGKKKISERKFFPGYLLINMELNDDTWFFIRKIPGVTGFIGLGNRPSSLSESEVESILKKSKETEAKPAPKVVFEKGESVRVVDGPFVNFNGSVEEFYPEKGRLKVNVSIFGRSTPVELEYWQVEKG